MSSIPEIHCTPEYQLPDDGEAAPVGAPFAAEEPVVCEDVDRRLGLPEGTAERISPQQLGLLDELHRTTVVGPSGHAYSLEEQAEIASELRGLGYDGGAPLTPELLDLGREYMGFAGLYQDERVQAFLGVYGLAMTAQPTEGFLNWSIETAGASGDGEPLGGGVMDSVRDQAVNAAIRLVAGDAARAPVLLARLVMSYGQNLQLERWSRVLDTPVQDRTPDDVAFDQAQRRVVAQALMRGMPERERDLAALGERQFGLLEDQRLTLVERIQDRLDAIGAGRGWGEPDRLAPR